LKEVTGPPSGVSTTARFTFEIASSASSTPGSDRNPLWELRGIAREIFEQLGGGENFIFKEREQFSKAVEQQGPTPPSSAADFTRVWQSVVANSGKRFSTITGLPFRYAMAGDSVWIERDSHTIEQDIGCGEFRKAWERWPVKGPGDLDKVVRGAGYIFGILSDSRVRKEAGY
jgi:hypothetical protein